MSRLSVGVVRLGLLTLLGVGSACQRVDWDAQDGSPTELTTTGAQCDDAWAQSMSGPRGDSDASMEIWDMAHDGAGGYLLIGEHKGWVRFGDLDTIMPSLDPNSGAAIPRAFVAHLDAFGVATWHVDLGEDLHPVGVGPASGGALVMGSLPRDSDVGGTTVSVPPGGAPVLVYVDSQQQVGPVRVLDGAALGVDLAPSFADLDPGGWIGGRESLPILPPAEPTDTRWRVQLLAMSATGALTRRLEFESLDNAANVDLLAMDKGTDQGVLVGLATSAAIEIDGQVFGEFGGSDAIVASANAQGALEWALRVEVADTGLSPTVEGSLQVTRSSDGSAWLAFGAQQWARVGTQEIDAGTHDNTVLARVEAGVLTDSFVVESDNSFSDTTPVALTAGPDGGALLLGSLTGEVHVGAAPATSWPPQRNSWLASVDAGASLRWVQFGNHRTSASGQSHLTPAHLLAAGNGAVQAGGLRGSARWDDVQLNFGGTDGAYVVRNASDGDAACISQ